MRDHRDLAAASTPTRNCRLDPSASDTDDANYFGATRLHREQGMRRDGADRASRPGAVHVTFTNNGNVALSITADDGIGTFDLAVGQTKSFSVSLAGPFSGSATAANTVSASSTYTDGAGTPKTVSHEASASCRVGSRVNVVKLTQGVIDPTKTWTFSIWSGTDSFGSARRWRPPAPTGMPTASSSSATSTSIGSRRTRCARRASRRLDVALAG